MFRTSRASAPEPAPAPAPEPAPASKFSEAQLSMLRTLVFDVVSFVDAVDPLRPLLDDPSGPINEMVCEEGKTEEGSNLLQRAAERGHLLVVRALLARPDIDVNLARPVRPAPPGRRTIRSSRLSHAQ